MENKVYKIFNVLESKHIFKGNYIEAINFVNQIAEENNDTDRVIINIIDAVDYINHFCDNLIMVY